MNGYVADTTELKKCLRIGKRRLHLYLTVAKRRAFLWGWRRHGYAAGSVGFGFGAFTYIWGHG